MQMYEGIIRNGEVLKQGVPPESAEFLGNKAEREEKLIKTSDRCVSSCGLQEKSRGRK